MWHSIAEFIWFTQCPFISTSENHTILSDLYNCFKSVNSSQNKDTGEETLDDYNNDINEYVNTEITENERERAVKMLKNNKSCC